MTPRSKARLFAATASVLASAAATTVYATPYASGVSESGGVVTFTLNEDADNVTIIRDGTPMSIGPQIRGPVMFPRSGAIAYSIVISKTAAPGYQNPSGANVGNILQISDDTNARNAFNSPRGVTVNNNPANGSLFGRVYVSNSAAGNSSGVITPIRPVGDGIYVNGADGSDPTAQGDNASTGGIDFITGGASSPYRLALDGAGFLYAADWSDGHGSVWRMDANVTTSSNLLVGIGGSGPLAPTSSQNHGSVAAVYAEGSAAGGNLTVFTLDEDMTPLAPTAAQMNSLWRYNVGSTTADHNGIPTQLAHVLIDFLATGGLTVDMARGPDGKFYLSQNRADGTDADSIIVVSSDGLNKLYGSLADTTARGFDADPVIDGVQDVLRRSIGVAASADGQWLAIGHNNSSFEMVPLIDGIPDLPNRQVVSGFPALNSGRDIAMDAAGNVYLVSSAHQSLRIWGAGKVSLTTLSSNGTFVYHNEPEWFVTGGGNYSTAGNWMLGYVPNGTDEIARFGNANTGGPTNVNLNVPVTLANIKFSSLNKYTISGTSQLTLDSTGEPRITVLQGSHDITAPVVANQNLQMTAIPSNSTLTVSNLTMTGGSSGALKITTAGAGTTAVNNFRAAALNVNGGRAKVITNGTNTGTSKVQALNIAGGATPIAKLDITNNGFVVDYPPPTAGPEAEPFDTIRAQIVAGYNGGGVNAWTGNGITTSIGNANTIGIGYAEASAIFLSFPNTFMGQTVDNTSVVFRETRYGDADLNGTVNLSDFNRLAGNFGVGTVWSQGDFNYDGMVNLTDFNLLAGNFGLSAGPDGPTAQDWAALAAVVPEPSMGMILSGVAASAAMSRRRRRAT